MKKYFLLFCLPALFLSCENKQNTNDKFPPIEVKYPVTSKVDSVDVYHGVEVKDPYRWLEDDRSTETEAWVKEENKVTEGYLSKIPFRDQVKKRLTEIWNYPKFSSPFKGGDKYYYFKNDGLQNQSVLYQQSSLEGEPSVFLDPNKLSSDGTIALMNISFSKDGKLAAYAVAKSGSDWNDIYIMDAESKQLLPDSINWAKFTGIAWQGEGFYYSRYDKPEGSAYSSKNEFHKVYYHKIGDPQDKDELIYEDADHPLRNFYASTTEDEEFLIVTASEGTSGNALFIKPRMTGEFVSVVDNFKNDHNVVGNLNEEEILMITNLDAPNNKLVRVNLKKPEESNWVEVIPNTDELLSSVTMAGGKLIVKYISDAKSKVQQFDYDGTKVADVQLPDLGTASGFYGKKDDNEVFYKFTSFTFPSNIYKYDIKENTSSLFRASEVDFDASKYETKQVFYESKDGTKVPMFIVHKKGLKLDGTNPTYLYAYGGFDISLLPRFSAATIVWLENGGIYAQPNIRGGGEYGQAWHEAGMKHNKQNVFDDFIAAGEYLIDQKYTSSERLAIAGGSNGGLLVGACMTQRPELFKVAFPAVGVLDMLRYHKFTIGWAWAVEYGSSDEEEHFQNLFKYSPLHNIKNTSYPATMVITADHDDRVVPAHSFKFAATLQEKNQGSNPVLIRIETKAGHGAGKPTSKIIEEKADVYSFAWYNMMFEPKLQK
ncbi:prolyl oligopeptidase family serine peptidase [Aureibacter tunicatorum]|uniref:prolyl oligopeptidase n=1 Tax=Aureibacter tunicatorum TaxID=866807 RepID=A0AAE4BRH3_9BACT|nr:prolyl oligopeptidase family serine peptidase [Aureibacter tunicatorum]MDR6237237.1 prolyl oligopeptidase [Aureibacter tunicatorum]BDD06229.1 prolyl endopeptidase [Aureibacter tunicatorum]